MRLAGEGSHENPYRYYCKNQDSCVAPPPSPSAINSANVKKMASGSRHGEYDEVRHSCTYVQTRWGAGGIYDYSPYYL
jgi:hypothetical protein